MAKKGRKASDESELEEFVRSYVKEDPVFTRPTPAAFARKSLMADLCRFERYALGVINKHGYAVAVTNGALRFLEPGGKSLYHPVYDEKLLARIVSQIKEIQSPPKDLEIAALIADAIPKLWRELQAGKISAEFASAVCRISAAVPDPDAATRLLSDRLSTVGRKGGEANKFNASLQKFIISIVKTLTKAKDGNVTNARVWKHLAENYLSDDPKETGIPDCDEVYTDGNKLCWTDRAGAKKAIAHTSLQRYVGRAKNPS